MRTDQQIVCAGKVQHKTKRDARAAIAKHREQRSTGRLTVYACPYCSGAGPTVWHIGHASAADLRRKRYAAAS